MDKIFHTITVQYTFRYSYCNIKITVYRFVPPLREVDPFDDDLPEDDLPEDDLPEDTLPEDDLPVDDLPTADRDGADRPDELRPIVDDLRAPDDLDPPPSFPMEDGSFRDGLDFPSGDFFIAGNFGVPELRFVVVAFLSVEPCVDFRSTALPVDFRVVVRFSTVPEVLSRVVLLVVVYPSRFEPVVVLVLCPGFDRIAPPGYFLVSPDAPSTSVVLTRWSERT